MTMLAFHADPAVKAKYLARVEAHREADQLVQGYGYWVDGKGCAVGCTIHSSNHRSYETKLGIPVAIAHLEDRIFEGLPVDDARQWPGRFLEAIPVGADLSGVIPRFLHWLLTSPEIGFSDKASDSGKIVIGRVADLFARSIAGDPVARDEWISARSAAAAAYAADAAAADAAADAAAAAAYAAAAYAAYAAAYAAADAAAYAADAAAADAAADAAAARNSCFSKMADRLIELLRDAPIPGSETDPA